MRQRDTWEITKCGPLMNKKVDFSSFQFCFRLKLRPNNYWTMLISATILIPVYTLKPKSIILVVHYSSTKKTANAVRRNHYSHANAILTPASTFYQ